MPALQAKTGQWSSFVAPDLAAIFSDSPGLDVCPSPEAQAKVLARLECMNPEAFEAELKQIAADYRQTSEAAPIPVETGTANITVQLNTPKGVVTLRSEGI
jgi:hypothetical protein